MFESHWILITDHIALTVDKHIFKYIFVKLCNISIHSVIYYHSTVSYNTSSWKQFKFISVPTYFDIYDVILWLHNDTKETSSRLLSMIVHNFRKYKKFVETYKQAQVGSIHSHSLPLPSDKSVPWGSQCHHMGCGTHTRDSGWMGPAQIHSHSPDGMSDPDSPGPHAVLRSL